MTQAELSTGCRIRCVSPVSERLAKAHASHLPKQQLPADRRVFLIRMLQLWMVHTVVIRPHGPHRLSLSGKGDRKEEERGGDGEEDGGIKTSRNCMSDNGRWKKKRRGEEMRKRGEG